MLDQLYNRPFVLARLRSSRFGDLLEDFASFLQAQRYLRSTMRTHIGAIEHFGSWLHRQPPLSRQLDQEAVRCFLVKHLPRCRCPSPAPSALICVRPALTQLLRFLRDRELLQPEVAEPTPALVAVEQFRHHLRETCGLAEATCRLRGDFALELLTRKFGHRALQWEALHPSDVVSFVTSYAKRCQPSSTQLLASSLRSFLRYLLFQGWGKPSLVAAVPRVANWRLASLPKTMTDAQFDAFLTTFDQTTATGKRDYAMALCLVYLGLRVSEVTDLLLEDLDWRAATLRIASRKTRRVRELPLPQRIGQALATYLRHGRPATTDRHVFVRHRRLQGAPVSASLVSNVMAMAFDKVPGCERWTGSHVLRHTAATRLHRRGANFKEIADLFGHRCLDTTFVYTKVDVPSLAAVADPWPEKLQ